MSYAAPPRSLDITSTSTGFRAAAEVAATRSSARRPRASTSTRQAWRSRVCASSRRHRIDITPRESAARRRARASQFVGELAAMRLGLRAIGIDAAAVVIARGCARQRVAIRAAPGILRAVVDAVAQRRGAIARDARRHAAQAGVQAALLGHVAGLRAARHGERAARWPHPAPPVQAHLARRAAILHVAEERAGAVVRTTACENAHEQRRDAAHRATLS